VISEATSSPSRFQPDATAQGNQSASLLAAGLVNASATVTATDHPGAAPGDGAAVIRAIIPTAIHRRGDTAEPTTTAITVTTTLTTPGGATDPDAGTRPRRGASAACDPDSRDRIGVTREARPRRPSDASGRGTIQTIRARKNATRLNLGVICLTKAQTYSLLRTVSSRSQTTVEPTARSQIPGRMPELCHGRSLA
jgi:hypothetical protein